MRKDIDIVEVSGVILAALGFTLSVLSIIICFVYLVPCL